MLGAGEGICWWGLFQSNHRNLAGGALHVQVQVSQSGVEMPLPH